MKFLGFVLFSLIALASSCRPFNEYFPEKAKAFAIVKGVHDKGQITGTVLFEQDSITSPIRISVKISGIPAELGPKHGFHVHQKTITTTSDVTAEICGSTGGHFNPLNKTHGDISAETRHVGDYGNVISDENGNIFTNFTDKISSLYGANGIIGRTLVLHQLEDDLGLKNNSGSLATGNAGGRIACGIIGIIP
ncbi:superoxide dismutase Sod1 [Brachionus plicatilis]|uniref:Superoxide dismutase [Cu-Zn] n=1 Tax=Brachionus plicatilis TaxID=10195 RepID=A0A3M7PUS9_BRAPC|nr:superoxide dismutase Sod1 [Brachionus plicatilis]WOL22078.1 CuZnSOD2 [Brachionus plicatilis]